MDLKTANRLQQLRKENGYSQDALAEKLGLSRQAISKWERGESSPDTDNLIALAELYHMTLDQLLGGEPSLLTPPQPAPCQAAAVAQPAEQPKTKEKRHALHGKLGKSLFKVPVPGSGGDCVCGFGADRWLAPHLAGLSADPHLLSFCRRLYDQEPKGLYDGTADSGSHHHRVSGTGRLCKVVAPGLGAVPNHSGVLLARGRVCEKAQEKIK